MPVAEHLRFAAGHRRMLDSGFALAYTSSRARVHLVGVVGPVT